mmetsp:Transcript_6616/g.16045  ORF Transcript_6616/g.16045 Transcript_6616/m.16045 type:complete len:207 (+) Transcript_6616:815-1435(+)
MMSRISSHVFSLTHSCSPVSRSYAATFRPELPTTAMRRASFDSDANETREFPVQSAATRVTSTRAGSREPSFRRVPSTRRYKQIPPGSPPSSPSAMSTNLASAAATDFGSASTASRMRAAATDATSLAGQFKPCRAAVAVAAASAGACPGTPTGVVAGGGWSPRPNAIHVSSAVKSSSSSSMALFPPSAAALSTGFEEKKVSATLV